MKMLYFDISKLMWTFQPCTWRRVKNLLNLTPDQLISKDCGLMVSGPKPLVECIIVGHHGNSTFLFVLQTVRSVLPPPMHKVLDPKRANIYPTERMVHLVAVSQLSISLLLWSAAPTG